jgi:hypothetical protein
MKRTRILRAGRFQCSVQWSSLGTRGRMADSHLKQIKTPQTVLRVTRR